MTAEVDALGRRSELTYDALGRRASRAADGSTTTFLYDGMSVVLDKANDGGSADYLSGFGADEHLRQLSSTTGASYFIQDHLGSIAALTNASGAVTERVPGAVAGAGAAAAAVAHAESQPGSRRRPDRGESRRRRRRGGRGRISYQA